MSVERTGEEREGCVSIVTRPPTVTNERHVDSSRVFIERLTNHAIATLIIEWLTLTNNNDTRESR
jgi:hypothetical protein